MRQVNSKRFGYIIAIALISAMLIQPAAPRPANSGAQGGTQGGTLQNQNEQPSALSEYPGVPGVIANGGNDAQEMKTAAGYRWQLRSYPTGKIPAQAKAKALAYTKRNIADALPAGLTWQHIGKQANPDSPITMTNGLWTFFGPRPLHSYANVSGRVTAIAVDQVLSSTVYIGTADGGVWKSTNCCAAGTAFVPVTDDPMVSTSSIGSIAIDPNNNNIIYVGTGEGNSNGDGVSGRGILKSSDAGATWVNLGAAVFDPADGAGAYSIGSLKVDPNNSQTVLAGTCPKGPYAQQGLRISNDGGVSWSDVCDVTGTGHAVTINEIVFDSNTNPSTIYVAGDGFGVYKSTIPMSGCPDSWTSLSTPARGWTNSAFSRVQLAMAPTDHNTLYAIAANDNINGLVGFWKSTNGGLSWTSGGNSFTDCHHTFTDGRQAWYDLYILIDPTSPNILFVGLIDIYKSTDGGLSFTNLSNAYVGGCPGSGAVHPDQHAAAYWGAGNTKLIFGNDGGVWSSTSGGSSQTDLNNTLGTIQFYSGDITPNFATDSAPNAFGGSQDNGSSAYFGNASPPLTWQDLVGGDGFSAVIEPNRRQHWYDDYVNGQLRCSTTGPLGNWHDCYGGWVAGGVSERSGFYTPFILDHNNCVTVCNHIVLGTYRVWESITGGTSGNTWVPISGDLTDNTGSGFITALAFAPGDTRVLYTGSSDGNVYYSGNTNTGTAANFINISGSNAVLPVRAISDISVDPNNPLNAYVSLSGFDTVGNQGHLFEVVCTAGCASFTWVDRSGNLPNIPVDAVRVNPLNPAQVFVGTDIGFFYTNNIYASPVSWYTYQRGMPVVEIDHLTIDVGNTTLAAFTHGRGMWAIPLPGPSNPLPSPTPTNTPTPTLAPYEFYDVPPGSIWHDFVHWLAQHGIVNGTSYGYYSPNANTTRAQFAKMITLGFGYPLITPTQPSFTDVPSSYFAYAFIETAHAQGIINGYSQAQCTAGGRVYPCFGPNDYISRAQLVIIAVRAKGWALVTPSTPTFSDVPTSGFAFAQIETAVSKGIISGFSDSPSFHPCADAGVQSPCFRPNNNGTRGQLSKILYLAINAAADTFTPTPTTTWTSTPLPPTDTATPTPTVTGTPPTATPTPTVTDTTTPGPPTATPSGCPNPFVDIQGDPSYDAILYLYCEGAVDGTDSTHFSPAADTSRAFITKAMVVGFGFPLYTPTAGQTFTDVPPSNPYFSYIESGYYDGIVSGYDAASCQAHGQTFPCFLPDLSVTRGQATKLEVNAGGYPFYTPTGGGQDFTDVPPSNIFYTSIETAYHAGLINGYPDHTFRPNNIMPRDDACQLTYNAMMNRPR